MECAETDKEDIAGESLEWKTSRRWSNTGSMQFSRETSRFLDHRHRSASGQPAAAAAEERTLEAAAARTVPQYFSNPTARPSVYPTARRHSGTFSRARKAQELSDAASLCVASVLLTFSPSSGERRHAGYLLAELCLNFGVFFEHNPIIHFGCGYISSTRRSHGG